jgi:outer membrane protein
MPSHARTRAGLLIAGAAVLISGLLAVPAATAQDRPTKIAVVNLDYVVAQSPAGKKLQALLEKFQQDVRSEGEQKRAAANQIRQQIVAGANSLPENQLGALQQQYEDATIEIRRFQEEKQREGEKMQAEGLREIERQLEPVFRQIQDERGYDLILANTPGVVVMASDRIDITQKVIDRLNSAAPGN